MNMDYEKAPPENCPQAVFDAVLDTPEPDKWVDLGEVRPLPMFHMHTLMKYGEKCAFTAVTHGVKMGWMPIESAPRDGRVILLARDMGGYGFVRGYGHFDGEPGAYLSGWISVGFDPVTSNLGLAHPTHWAPLPPPPKD